MELLSPQKFDISHLATATSDAEFQYRDDASPEIIQHGRITKLFTAPEVSKLQVQLAPATQVSAHEFLKIQRLVNVCVNNAEEIKRKLHEAVRIIYRHKPELAKASVTYDFMKLKDIFTDYVKKDTKTRHLANKEFRKAFNQFVIDRNTYTHGKLMIRHEDNAFIIMYIDNSTKISSYAVLNFNIIQSYLDTYKAISLVLLDFIALTQ